MPTPDCQVLDPRIRRTRQFLHDALRQLMLTRNFDEISVHDITEAAIVNRATFYDHYNDKHALLEEMVAGGFHQLLASRGVQPDDLGAIVLATCDYLTLAFTGGKCQRQTAAEPLMDAAMTSAIQCVLMQAKQTGARANALPHEVLVASASWAILGAVKQWFRTPERLPVETIVPRLVDLIGLMFDSAE